MCSGAFINILLCSSRLRVSIYEICVPYCALEVRGFMSMIDLCRFARVVLTLGICLISIGTSNAQIAQGPEGGVQLPQQPNQTTCPTGQSVIGGVCGCPQTGHVYAGGCCRPSSCPTGQNPSCASGSVPGRCDCPSGQIAPSSSTVPVYGTGVCAPQCPTGSVVNCVLGQCRCVSCPTGSSFSGSSGQCQPDCVSAELFRITVEILSN